VILSTFVLAHLAHAFVEEPARKRLRQVVPSRRPTIAPVHAAAAAPAQPRIAAARTDRPLAVAPSDRGAVPGADAPRTHADLASPVPARRAEWMSA
jgi:hypothetical protein